MAANQNKKIVLLIVTVVLAVAAIFLGYRYFFGKKASAPGKQEEALAAFRNLDAYNQYFQGRNYWNRQDERSIRRAIVFFNEAIQLDTTMAAAYSGLADCYSALGYGSYECPDSAFPKAKAASLRALQLDPTLADAHTSLGYVLFYYYRNWAEAEKEFTAAIQSNPHYEMVFDSYTYYLTSMERFSEARIAIEKALQINPLSVKLQTDRGFFFYYSGHYDEAIETLRPVVAGNARNPLAHLWLGRAYEETKHYEEAIGEFRAALAVNKHWPVAMAALGWVYGMSGQPEKAGKILDTLLRHSEDRFVTPYGIALVYAGLHDKDKTFEWLEKAYAGRSNWLVWLKLDPRWATVRSDRRFGALLEKVGLIRGKGSL